MLGYSPGDEKTSLAQAASKNYILRYFTRREEWLRKAFKSKVDYNQKAPKKGEKNFNFY
jgi:hypothetical protein